MSLTTTVMCDKCGKLGDKESTSFSPDDEGKDRYHYCKDCVRETLNAYHRGLKDNKEDKAEELASLPNLPWY